jgi:aminocarboxymuconate-semialdehyde decarboxylase
MTLRIDTQAHYAPGAYRAALAAYASSDDAFASLVAPQIQLDPDALACRVDEQRLADLDAAGCDVQVLSVFPPGAAFGPRELAAETARATNDDLLAAAAPFGGRFLALGTLPLPYVEESLAELDRIGREPAFRGVSLPAAWEPWRLDDPTFDPIYRRLAELGLVLVVHPAIAEWPPIYRDWGLAGSIGLTVGTTVASLRLILSGMLDRVPLLDVIVTHLGGSLTFLFQRVAGDGRGNAEHDLGHYLRERVWLDSYSNHLPALRCAIETVGADRIVFGSDYPARSRLEDGIAQVQTAGLRAEEQHAILGGTAARWFGPERAYTH